MRRNSVAGVRWNLVSRLVVSGVVVAGGSVSVVAVSNAASPSTQISRTASLIASASPDVDAQLLAVDAEVARSFAERSAALVSGGADQFARRDVAVRREAAIAERHRADADLEAQLAANLAAWEAENQARWEAQQAENQARWEAQQAAEVARWEAENRARWEAENQARWEAQQAENEARWQAEVRRAAQPATAAPAPAPAASPRAAAPAPAAAPAAPAPAPAPPPAPAPAPASVQGDASAVLSLLNGLRSSLGLAPLVADAGLMASADAQAHAIASAGSLFHQDLHPLLGAWNRAGENVGYGPSVGTVHDGLVASPGHYENMTSAQFTHVGVAVVHGADGRVWVAQVFGG